MDDVNTQQRADLAVIGGGSGGFAAALSAARRGLRVVLIEAGPRLGGASTRGGVNTWEPGIGGPGLHRELFGRLNAIPQAAGISRTTKSWTREQPWSFSEIDPTGHYRDSLRRSGLAARELRRVTFEPDALAASMLALLTETGRVDLRMGTRLVAADACRGRIESIVVEAEGRQQRLPVRLAVDCSGQLDLACAAGCQTYLGCEPRSLYHEPHAPLNRMNRLNGVSLCFRVSPRTRKALDPLPEGVPDEPYPCSLSITQYPCGDLNINPLPVMQGMEFHRIGAVAGRVECERRVYRLWRWMQAHCGFDRYRLVGLFPATGVREGPRLMGRRVLSENDIRRGCSDQADAGRWITLADHALDVHGEGHMCRELQHPYGVPWECLLPREYDNLAVACRGASFSHIAAASCRLSRTMMQLGHAAGIAAALAIEAGVGFPDVDVRQLQAALAVDDVALSPVDERFPQPHRTAPAVTAGRNAMAAQAGRSA